MPRPGARPPSVDNLARSLADLGLPHPLLVDAARDAIASGEPETARARAEAAARSLLQPVVNATGVLLHTNLGRAPLAVHHEPTATNLEFDLGSGRRGSRRNHAGALLARLVGAEAALVVNNGAGAVLLVLAALAAGRSVIVSRGELVEIGGGFRIPEVLETCGARLIEVGTTNRTRLDDYKRALEAAEDVTVILKVHQSNYRLVGFTESAPLPSLSQLGPPVVADIGSGLLDAQVPWLPGGPPPWLAGEPAARQTLAQGAAVVTFSGDKLLGGPQAGILAGRRGIVEACAAHPLARALRPGGLVLRSLQETALCYLERRAASDIPFWAMATLPLDVLERRAKRVAEASGAEVAPCTSVVGGGALPGMELPSVAVALGGDHRAALRRWTPPIIARTEEGRTLCDLRTVPCESDEVLRRALVAIGSGSSSPESAPL
jgi:L-seryl-tRNA(Ser) seleniumtransferase